MPVSAAMLEQLRTEPNAPERDLSWLKPGTPWGFRANVGRKGFTIEQAEQGAYGNVPDLTANFTGRPRGTATSAAPPPASQHPCMALDDWCPCIQRGSASRFGRASLSETRSLPRWLTRSGPDFAILAAGGIPLGADIA